MTLRQVKEWLARNESKFVRFVLPTAAKAPPHVHVTEVARVDKRFIDCGGTVRTDSICRLQLWHQDDTDHRLTAGKLRAILAKSDEIIGDDSLEVEIEHEAPFISQFPLERIDVEGDVLLARLGIKHTDCLAQDRCLPPKPAVIPGIKPLPVLQQSTCCGSR